MIYTPCARPWQGATVPVQMDMSSELSEILDITPVPGSAIHWSPSQQLSCSHLHHVLRLERVQTCSRIPDRHLMSAWQHQQHPYCHLGTKRSRLGCTSVFPPEVGSSRKMTAGLPSSACPKATRFLSPPLTPRVKASPAYAVGCSLRSSISESQQPLQCIPAS